MPLEKNRPTLSRKKDGKPHKNKNHDSIYLFAVERGKNFISGNLFLQLFDELNIDIFQFIIDNAYNSEYSGIYYCPAENAIYINTNFLGSGWKGSPSEFFTCFEEWKKIDNSFIPQQFYFDFMERNNGAILGYDIYNVPSIKMYEEG